ncbi:HAD family hydrolase [Melittangium boletus]|uniref:Haloacid dehalogenase n=1 Tax=Melittangium boletus DSM 14713 TaxID=1294270 RepID=A0A286NVE4_9BACT|nr:HAD-IB family hydrolase [Melittangium boletus]ATB27107.1 haloacid dehalogenase [Melittangium boletus DSM 14713]
MGIAFFDLDKTLLAVNSASLWVRDEFARGHITRLQALGASAWIARYHLGFVPMKEALLRAISFLQGTSEALLRERTTRFYETRVRSQFRPGALRALEEHRSAGDRLVLLTSSSGYMSELVARDLRLAEVLCNRFEVDAQGLHTGRPLGEVCFGEGKRVHAEACASRAGVALADCSFYTDSYSDLPVMEVVGNPVAVHPDRRLRREAARRGWRVVDWGAPAPPR